MCVCLSFTVLYGCTNSALSNETAVVYMDMGKAPLYQNSTCYCTVTFAVANENLNRVRLAYKIKSSTNTLSVNLFGQDRFSTEDTTRIADTTLKINNVIFTLTYPKTEIESCLRISSEASKFRFFFFYCL